MRQADGWIRGSLGAMALVGMALTLAGCDGTRQTVSGLSSCGGEAMQGWIGQPAGPLASQLPGVRVLDSGSPTTYDFRPERLNAHVNSDGVVTGLSCG
ncbi:I78 family peptidase inhibitor [Insolitispirillum peregrinum]|uniref:Peptidase inhibitor I78 family protein n=1 Tax=Insolitispirillum peregrinum TaxID=80876 RepID=A0A1N7JI12_9PROT|nr:I78 family peptidase inhibitor [Insolitispirillum peregrinum]SIS48896.1 Peptidase inhibitor I78 family protein [Insolitispirillum peregrinum]